MARRQTPSTDPRWRRCDVARLIEPDLAAIEMLARLALESRRGGRRLLLVHASPALRALVAFAGLEDVLWLDPPIDPPARVCPDAPADRTAGSSAPCRGRR